jgi:hypothetical protein
VWRGLWLNLHYKVIFKTKGHGASDPDGGSKVTLLSEGVGRGGGEREREKEIRSMLNG